MVILINQFTDHIHLLQNIILFLLNTQCTITIQMLSLLNITTNKTNQTKHNKQLHQHIHLLAVFYYIISNFIYFSNLYLAYLLTYDQHSINIIHIYLIFQQYKNILAKMQTIKSVLMSNLVKIIAPQSPAYGNTIPFVKEQSLQQIISTLQPGDIIFTKTNNSLYQACRKLLNSNYDHVSVVINKNQVIHISPPIISKLDINRIMVPSRQPLIYRVDLNEKSKQVLMNILTNYIGEKYNESAIPSMLKNQLVSRVLKSQQNHQFTFQSLKYSKICTQAILYGLCKSKQQLYNSISQFVNTKTEYKKIGFIMPDELKNFLEQNNARIVHKSAETTEKTLLTKIQQNLQPVFHKLLFVTDFASKFTPGNSSLRLLKQLGIFSVKLKQQSLIFKIVSILYLLYEIKYGNKFNKFLLLYSTLATVMMLRMLPQTYSLPLSNKSSKL